MNKTRKVTYKEVPYPSKCSRKVLSLAGVSMKQGLAVDMNIIRIDQTDIHPQVLDMHRRKGHTLFLTATIEVRQ